MDNLPNSPNFPAIQYSIADLSDQEKPAKALYNQCCKPQGMHVLYINYLTSIIYNYMSSQALS